MTTAIYRDNGGLFVWATDKPGMDPREHPGPGWWYCTREGYRIISPELPPRRSREECERDLEAYAQAKGWHRA